MATKALLSVAQIDIESDIWASLSLIFACIDRAARTESSAEDRLV
jgi:hypothetical protein